MAYSEIKAGDKNWLSVLNGNFKQLFQENNYDQFWSRDYVLGNNLSRPNDGNDFALTKFNFVNNFSIIVGRGSITVNQSASDYWESTLTIPWKVSSASLILSDWMTYKGYFKAHHGVSADNTVAISASGKYTNETITANLLIVSQI